MSAPQPPGPPATVHPLPPDETAARRPGPPPKGRAVFWAVESRRAAQRRQAEDDGWGGLDAALAEPPRPVPTTVLEQPARSILSRNDSPDIGFDVSINPYRGCEHGCVYCYARPTHAYLDLSPGLDFETRLVAKTNAAERLRAELAAAGYVPSPLAIGAVTDAYQPVERELRLTRGVIEVLAEARHPFSIVTKSSLVERDLDLIAPMARERMAAVFVSLTTLDAALARRMEPRAAAPHRRLRTIETLARAGVPVGVSVSPVIPFLNEPEVERILAAAADAGATSAFSIVLRLPWELGPLLRRWLAEHVPDKAERIMARVQEMRGGRDNDSRFGSRMTGQGVWAELLRQRIDKARRRHGLGREKPPLDASQFRPPARQPGQASLF